MNLKTEFCVIFLFYALLVGMDPCAELGTLVIWACVRGILSFEKI